MALSVILCKSLTSYIPVPYLSNTKTTGGVSLNSNRQNKNKNIFLKQEVVLKFQGKLAADLGLFVREPSSGVKQASLFRVAGIGGFEGTQNQGRSKLSTYPLELQELKMGDVTFLLCSSLAFSI